MTKSKFSGKQTLLVIIMAFIPIFASAQMFSGLKVGGGITTAWINGDNAATKLIGAELGGGFNGTQSGFGLRLRYGLDEKDRFRMIGGLDYISYEGLERAPVSSGLTFRFVHSLNIPTIVLGGEYTLAAYNKLAKLYAGAEARMAFISGQTFTVNADHPEFISDSLRPYYVGSFKVKEPVSRFGAAVKIGIEAELQKDIFIDVNGGYGAINLFGRDDTRGELLTRTALHESRESVVGNIIYSIMVMYKF